MDSQNLSILTGFLISFLVIVGLILIIFRPYYAFLLATFVSIAIPIGTMTYTRMEETGSFLNLYDVCLLVSFAACFVDNFFNKYAFRLPKMALALILIIIIGFLVSTLSSLGMTYGVVRSVRWAIGTPLLYIIAANLVNDEKRVKLLLGTLIVATFCSGALYYLSAVHLSMGNISLENPEDVRTGDFLLSSPEVWLLTGPFLVGNRVPGRWLQLLIGVVLLSSLLFRQSRGAILGLFLGLVAYHLWFLKRPNAFHKKRLLPLIQIFLFSMLLFMMFNLTALSTHAWERIYVTFSGGPEAEDITGTRKNAFYVEGGDFLYGNIITIMIGRGLNYYEIYSKRPSSKLPLGVAWGHLGYITYLSQLGLLGFIFYAILFPASVILRARSISANPNNPPAITYLASLAGGCFIFNVFYFLFTNSYLTTQILSGILAGGVWRISLMDVSGRMPLNTT